MSFSLKDLWISMGFIAKGVVFLLLIMSIMSIWTFVERWLLFSSAKKQSLLFIGKVGNLLKANRLDECIDLARKYKNSHIAKVFSAALLEFKVDTAEGVNYNIIT